MKKEDIKEIENPTERSRFFASCSKCGKIVVGSTKDQVLYNMARHFNSKACKSRSFELRVQNELPQRTPGYQSPVSNKEDKKISKAISQKDESLHKENKNE